MKKQSQKENSPKDEDIDLKNVDHKTLEALLTKHLKWSQLIYEQNQKIEKRLLWMAIAGYVRLAIILIPLILAIVYLPPLLSNFLEQYQAVVGVDVGNLNLQEIFTQINSTQTETNNSNQ